MEERQGYALNHLKKHPRSPDKLVIVQASNGMASKTH
jgi:hypothetical protein